MGHLTPSKGVETYRLRTTGKGFLSSKGNIHGRHHLDLKINIIFFTSFVLKFPIDGSLLFLVLSPLTTVSNQAWLILW